MDNNKTLSAVYFDEKHPASYGAAKSLEKHTRLKPQIVGEWLSMQDTYTLHKPVRRKFKRRKTIANKIDSLWQMDLVFLLDLAKHNRGFKYLLTVIDVFSRYAFVRALKSKHGSGIIAAMKDIFNKEKRKPSKIHIDKGAEFMNHGFIEFLKTAGNIKLYASQSDQKASLAERFNRTLKTKMFRYFTHNNTKNYIDVLPDLVKSYNHRVHRSIGMAPADVNKKHESMLWEKMYRDQMRYAEPKYHFQLGDLVRIAKKPETFGKSYKPLWSEEIFTVKRRRPTVPVTYVLEDDAGEHIQGSFYRSELQKVKRKLEKSYPVDVLQKKQNKNGTWFLVHYRGWPDKFDEWIRSEQLAQLEKRT